MPCALGPSGQESAGLVTRLLGKISSTTTQRVPICPDQGLKNELRITVLPCHVCVDDSDGLI